MNPKKPVLRYPGSKQRLAAWITAHFPPHRVYVDPYCGSLCLLLAKPRSPVEIVNDRDSRLCNLFRVLRDDPEPLIRAIALTPYARAEFHAARPPHPDPIEDARRTLVLCWMSVGSTHNSRSGWRADHRAHTPTVLVWRTLPDRLAAVVERLQGVQIENRDALPLILQRNDPDRLYYCDPPYLFTTRARRLYNHEMGHDADHHAMIQALQSRAGAVVLSGYPNALYDQLLPGWQRVSTRANAMTGEPREECLWLNPTAARGLASRLPGLDAAAGESEP